MSQARLFNLTHLALACKVKQPEHFVETCAELESLLTETNRYTNLTRICDHDDFINKHVADSLLIAKYFPELTEENITIADIGCGAGFPALILAIAYPNLQITAIDSNQKKCAFVASAAEKLALPNLQVIAGRARELNRQAQWQGKFTIITARAVAEAASIFKETKKMLANDGRFIFYKTPQQVVSDLPQLEKFSQKYNFSWATTEIYLLPGGDGQRQFIHSIS